MSTMAKRIPAHEANYYGWRSWVVVFTSALFFFYEFMQLNMFNALDTALIREFHVTAMQLGELSAHYFYSEIIFLLPAGIILDRVSTRKIILVAMCLTVGSTFLFAIAQQFWITEICRFMTGFGGAFCFLSSIRLASRWFPPRRMALVIGLIVTMAMAGGVVAQTPFTWLTDAVGWRKTLMIDGAIGLLFIALIATFVKDYPPGYEVAAQQNRAQLDEFGFWYSLRLALRNLQNWLGGLYTSFLNLPIFLLGGMWGSMYLVQAQQLTRIQASVVNTMIFVGTIIGSPVLGWLSDRIARRRMPMIVCAIISLIIILAVIYLPHLNFWLLLILFLLLGFFTSAQIISYPLIAESSPHALIGTSTGLASVLIMSGGLTQPYFGWLMDLHWNHKLINQVPFYAVSDYRLAMSIMPIAFILGLIAALLVKETYCRPREFDMAKVMSEK